MVGNAVYGDKVCVLCVLTSVATTELSSHLVIETPYLRIGVSVEILVKQEKTSKLLYSKKLQEYSTSLPS